MRRILLVNPNTTEAHTARMVEAARAAAPAWLAVDGATVTRGVPLIRDEAGFAAAADAVAGLLAADPPAVDGVIIAAFADPGLETARTLVDVPVVGIAEAAMLATAPEPFAVATTLPGLDERIRRRAADYGCGDRLVAVRTTAGDGAALMADPAALEAALAEVVLACAADGARQVVIGGGPLADVARALAGRLEVPVVAPIPAAVRRLVRLLA
jgi:Asp/Glu/hydantoin racemase